MEVTVPADRRTRAAIPFFLKSLSPSKALCGNRALPAFSGKLLVSGGML
jgi:hypothetical protein